MAATATAGARPPVTIQVTDGMPLYLALTRGDVAAAARALGWITVLLDRPVPQGPQAQRVWAGELGLADPGVEVHTEARLR